MSCSTRPNVPPRLGTSEFNNIPTDSIDYHHHRQSKSALKSPISPRNSTDITASRKSSVTFGQCEIHHLSPHLTIEYESDEQYSSTETLNESELQDLIESEAIALTEDAIFLAKREIYRELFNISDQSIGKIAQNLVDETISEVLKDLYYPDAHRHEGGDEGEAEPTIVPFDYDVRADHPQRLDSIQEESETSDNSINVSG